MNTFEALKHFIVKQMQMSHVYQPVMLMELLKHGGTRTKREIARALLNKDQSQIEYYSEIVQNMVGRVLTRNRGITERDGDRYTLKGADALTDAQREELIELCKQKIEAFETRRGAAIWEHRRRGQRPIPGSIRYEVLKRASFRCELCGVSADLKGLEVDHIHPRSLGGKDGFENYQALCFSCNASKRNTDDTDFRVHRELYKERSAACLFCEAQHPEAKRVVASNTLAFAIRDHYPVTPLHTLILPMRHVADYFDLKQPEVNAVHALLQQEKDRLRSQDSSIDGFNIGMNCGETAGQTIFHCHVHLIPRRKGDVENPRGGVRHLIPGKGFY